MLLSVFDDLWTTGHKYLAFTESGDTFSRYIKHSSAGDI